MFICSNFHLINFRFSRSPTSRSLKSLSTIQHLLLPDNINLLLRGSIKVLLTSCFTALDLTKQVNLLFIGHKQSSWIQSSKTGGQVATTTYRERDCLRLIFAIKEMDASRAWGQKTFSSLESILFLMQFSASNLLPK